jgi:hypothetical protein
MKSDMLRIAEFSNYEFFGASDFEIVVDVYEVCVMRKWEYRPS